MYHGDSLFPEKNVLLSLLPFVKLETTNSNEKYDNTTITIKGTLVSKPYIAITLDVMARFGVNVAHSDYATFKVKGGQQYQSLDRIMVEGDASSASYFVAAAAIAGGEIEIKGVGA